MTEEITELIKLVGGGGVLITILVGVLRLGRLMEKVEGLVRGQAELKTKLEADIETVRAEGRETYGLVMQLIGNLRAPAPTLEGKAEVKGR